MRTFLIPLCLIGTLIPVSLPAHQVRVESARVEAVELRLSYGDGRPFAGQRYELQPTAGEGPVHDGTTDASGRILFLPDGIEGWTVRAFAEHGHGIQLDLQVDSVPTSPVGMTRQGMDPLSAGITGLGLVFGLFGLYQMWRCRGSGHGA